jgi:hypothetical protein
MNPITAGLIRAYFSQGTQYYSESANAMIQIKDMHPAYAANAARRLLLDATRWARDAGQQTKGGQRGAAWVLGTNLFQALTIQATS